MSTTITRVPFDRAAHGLFLAASRQALHAMSWLACSGPRRQSSHSPAAP